MADGKVKRLCVHWPRLGPYHLARLAGVHAQGQPRSREVIALETAGIDDTYAWKQESAETPYRREVVFPDRVYERIDATTLHRGVTTALDRLNPDAVAITSYSTPDARACLLWCKKHKRPALLMISTREADAVRIGWRESIKSILVNLYDAALAGGTPQQHYLEKLGFPVDRIFQGCDVVDNAFFASEAARIRQNPASARHLIGLDEDTPFFLASNRFILRKNLDGLLEAYRRYRNESDAPWRLLLLGDGAERSPLEARVQEDRIEGVVFCGFRQLDELPAYYARAGAFVHPARVEQWGLVVNEAMAAGLPVLVSSGAGCAHDLVQPGRNGYVFDPDRPDELAGYLRLLSSPETDREAMSRASEAIVSNWSPDRFGSQLWAAADAGLTAAQRRAWPGRTVLRLIQTASRRVDSFHSVEK